MIDELIEYKEYIDKKTLNEVLNHNSKQSRSNDYINIRLKYSEFVNDFSGLKRALTIISKYYLSKYHNDETIALNALKAWSGFEYESINEEIDSIAGYVSPELFEFYHKNTKSEATKKLVKELEERFIKKKRRFFEDIINNDSLASKAGLSDQNKTTFSSIIYNCKNKPLTRKVLVCKKPILDEVKNLKHKKITDKQYDFLLKTICTYLKFNTKNLNEINIVMSDIYNWSLYSHNSNELKNYIFSNQDNPIIYNSYNKKVYIGLDQRIKENYYLVDYNDVENKVEYGDIVYIDKGASSIMKKVEIENNNDIMNLLQELQIFHKEIGV